MNGKKYVILLTELIILCVFCSCNKSDSASKIPQINCEYGYFNYVVPGEDGYYLLCNGLIGFWDGNMNHKATPLCKRPDCSHNTNECSACIYGAKLKMFYVNGYLYLFSLIGSQNSVNKSVKFPLWKVAVDGSSKEVALYASDIPQKYTVFQNKIYYEIQAEDENGKLICRVLCQPLEGGEEEQIWKSSLQNGSLGILQGIGEKLYFSEKGLDPSLDTNDPEFDFEKAEYQKNFYAYQPETGELVRNPDFNGKDGSKIVIRNIYDGKLFYSYWDDIKNELWYQSIEGEEEVCLGSQPPFVCIADSDYSYTSCLWDKDLKYSSIKAYDHDGNLKQELRFYKREEDLKWIPATEEYLFGYFEGEMKGNKWDTAIVVLERDKIAEGKAEMIRIFENK